MHGTITAIIPTFNRGLMLRDCIDSILRQTRPVDEIIVVNDGSTDRTEDIARSYGGRIKLLSKANGGKASALNLGLAHCTSDYVWICDDDDWADTNGAEHLAAALDIDPAIGFAYGSFEIFTVEDDDIRGYPPTYWRREEEPNTLIAFMEEMFTFQFAMMVRRALYAQVGGFREDLIRSQDYEMTLRLCRHAKSAYVPRIIFYQRKHDGQRGSASNPFTVNENEIRWLEFDRLIFTELRKDVPLAEFTPTFALDWPLPLVQRAAFLQRACVMAKRALWAYAIDDLMSAVEVNAASPSTEEIHVAESVVRTEVPWDILCQNPKLLAEVKTCYRANPYGRAIVQALCRPLIWQALRFFRGWKLKAGLRRIWLMVAVLGVWGSCKRTFLSALD